MRLYYMTTLETLEQHILPELRIRLSTFDTVNDPFELLAMTQGGEKQRRHFSWLYDHWVATLGFVSFSENWKSPLMWAHYARSHTGVCLGFEVPDGRALKVCYEPERLHLLLDVTKLETALDEDVIKKVVTTKFKDWEYEHEWRLIEPLENQDAETGLYYLYLSPYFELREIIVGSRCGRSLEDIRQQIYGNTGEITMFKVRPAFGSFSMVRQKLVETRTISPLHKLSLRRVG